MTQDSQVCVVKHTWVCSSFEQPKHLRLSCLNLRVCKKPVRSRPKQRHLRQAHHFMTLLSLPNLDSPPTGGLR